MKNIHLLLTGESYLSLNCSYRDSAIGTQVGKPYWTYSKDWKHHMSVTDASVRPHNIYITSDEEIKNCYYFNSRDNAVRKNNNLNHPYHHKIILTDNKDLIKDGVQAIDDKFLEWFVKNPSCEYVKVTEHLDAGFSYGYKIIIPKEEPKLQCKDCNDNLTDCTCIEDTIDMKQTPGKETADYIDRHVVEAMVEVAKQNLYSEVFQWLASRDYLSDKVDIIQKEFEQFKKK